MATPPTICRPCATDRRPARRPRLATVGLLLPLAACATARTETPAATDAGPLQAAVTQPLDDLNLAPDDPAAALVRAAGAPDRPPAGCADAARELAGLEQALGSGRMAAPAAPDAADVAAGVVRSVVRLPFRGVVRELTGAERRAKQRQARLYAGMFRRGYLDGWRTARGCDVAVAPRLALPPFPS